MDWYVNQLYYIQFSYEIAFTLGLHLASMVHEYAANTGSFGYGVYVCVFHYQPLRVGVYCRIGYGEL